MILVTGGTGFVGHEVVEELLRLGYRVRLLVRDPARAGRLASDPRVELVRGDLLKPETLPPAMEKLHAVIHLVGIISETSQVTYEQAHVEATRHLLAAAKQAGVTRWVQMSASGTRPHAASRYHRTKWEAEEYVRSSGMDWTIFRPSLIYGYDERDRLLNLLRAALSSPFDFIQLYSFPLINGGEPLIQPVSVREVAYCFAHAAAKEASIGRTFDLVGPVAFSWRKMVTQVLAVLGKKEVYEDVPLLLILRAWLWLAVALLPCGILGGWVTGTLPLAIGEICAAVWVILFLAACRWRKVILFRLPGDPLILASEPLNDFAPRELRFSEMLKMAVEDNIGDPRPAAETFGYTPETFEQGLRRIYQR
jgi:uncharacterized protein YbjT (DUF2867 family)